MTDRIAYVEAVFGADITNFRRGTAEVRRELGVLSDNVRGLSDIGRQMTMMVTAPLLALGTAAVAVTAEFDANMRNVNSILQISESQFAALSEQTRAFGAEVRSGPVAAADTLYTIVSAGFTNAEDAFGVMEVVTRTAEAGLSDLRITAEAVASSMLAFGETSAAAAQQFSDVITREVALGVGSMQSFVTANATVMPIAAALGLTFADTAQATAYLTQRGVDARTATTQLGMALNALMKPTEDMQAAFDQLGVRSASDLITQFGGLQGALVALGNTVDNQPDMLARMFGRQQATRAVLTLLNDIPQWTSFIEEFYTGIEGATDAAQAQQNMSFDAHVGRMTSALAGLGIVIGEQVLPVLTPMIDMFRDVLLFIQGLPPEVIALAVAFGAAAAAAGPLMWLLGNLASPISIVLGLISGLGIAFATDFGGIRTTVENAANGVLNSLSGLIEGIETFFAVLFPAAPDTSAVDAMFDSITETISGRVQNLTLDIAPGQTIWDVWVELDPQLQEGFTWETFRDAAMEAAGLEFAGGLQVGKLTIPLDIGLDTGGVAPYQQLNELALLPMTRGTADFGSRLRNAFEQSWPQIRAGLQTVLDNVLAWFNETFFPGLGDIGEGVLTSIGEWFSNSSAISGQMGKTGLYEAFRLLLSGDFAGALDAVTPGWGTALASGLDRAAGGIPGMLASFAKGFGELLSGLGTWLIDTGVPTVARSVGYLMGRIGSMIADGFRAIAGFITGGGAGDAAGNAAQVIGNSVITPFTEGFNDALQDAGVEPGSLDGFMTLLAGAIGLAIAGQFVFNLLSAGVGRAIWGAVTTVMGLTRGAVSLFATFMTGFAGVLNDALGSLLTASGLRVGAVAIWARLSAAMSSVVTSITNAPTWVALYAEQFVGWIGGAISQAAAGGSVLAASLQTFASGLASLASAAVAALPWVLTVAAGIVLGSVLYFSLPPETQAALQNMVSEAFDGVFGEGATASFRRSFEDFVYSAIGRSDLRSDAVTPEVQANINVQANLAWQDLAETGNAWIQHQSFGLEFAAQLGLLNAPIVTSVPVHVTPRVMGTSPVVPTPEDIADMRDISSELGRGLVVPAIEGMQQGLAEGATSIQLDMSSEAQGVMFGAAITGELEESFTTAFSDGGTVRTLWETFVTNFIAKSQEVLLEVRTTFPTIVQVATEQLSLLAGAFQPVQQAITDTLNGVNDLAAAIASLSNTNLNIGVAGAGAAGVEVDRHRASGGRLGRGMASWVGERGPEIFIPDSAGTVIPNDALDGMGGGNTVVTTNIVNISGVSDIDRLLYDLRRRGIVLNGR